MGIDPTIPRLALERTIHCTVLDLLQATQKDNMRVEQWFALLRRKFYKNSHGVFLKQIIDRNFFAIKKN